MILGSPFRQMGDERFDSEDDSGATPNFTQKNRENRVRTIERRGMGRGEAERLIAGLASDAGAQYSEVIELDAEQITPMVATPGDPGNGKYIRELSAPVPIEIAHGGTCTAGKNEDKDMYARVLADALAQGKRVADSVKFYIQFGSQETQASTAFAKATSRFSRKPVQR